MSETPVDRLEARVLGGALWVEGSAGDTAFVPAGDLDTVLLALLVEVFADGETLTRWLAELGVELAGAVSGPIVSFALADAGLLVTDHSGGRLAAVASPESLVLPALTGFARRRRLTVGSFVEWLGDIGVHVAHLT